MATSFIIARATSAPLYTVWSENDGVFASRGALDFLDTIGGTHRAWYSNKAKYLIVAIQGTPMVFRAYLVDPLTGLIANTTPVFTYSNASMIANIGFISYSDDRERFVINTSSSTARQALVINFSEATGFTLDATLTFANAEQTYPQFRFPKGSKDHILALVQNATSANLAMATYFRSGSTWTMRSQYLNGSLPSGVFDCAYIGGADKKIRVAFYSANIRLLLEIRAEEENNPFFFFTFGNANAASTRRAISISSNGRRIYWGESSTTANTGLISLWELGAGSVSNFTQTGQLPYFTALAESPRDVKAGGTGDSVRAAIGRRSTPTATIGTNRVAMRTDWNGSSTLPGTNAPNEISFIDWSPDLPLVFAASIGTLLAKITGSFSGRQQKATVAATLGKMSGQFSLGIGNSARFATAMSPISATFEAWSPVLVDMPVTLRAMSLAIESASLETEPMPGAEVHLEYMFARLTSEAPVIETEYPSFGYFDDALLPAMRSIFNAKMFNNAAFEVSLPSMRSDGKVSFPIETNFTSALPKLIASVEGTADNFRDSEIAFDLPAMSAAATVFQTAEAELDAELSAALGDILVFRTVTAALGGMLGSMRAAMAGFQEAQVTIDADLAPARFAGRAVVGFGMFVSARLGTMSGDFTVWQNVEGDLEIELPAVIGEGGGGIYNSVRLPMSLAAMQGDFAGRLDNYATLETAFAPMTSDSEVWMPVRSEMVGTLASVTFEGHVEVPYIGVDITLPAMTMEAYGISPKHADLDSVLAAMTSKVTAFVSNKARGDSVLAPMISAFELWHDVLADMPATLPRLRADIGGRVINPSELETSLPAMTADVKVGSKYLLTLSAELPRIRSNIEAWIPVRLALQGRLPTLVSDGFVIAPKEAKLTSVMAPMSFAARVEAPYAIIVTALGAMSFDGFFNVPTGAVLGGRLPSPMKADIYAGPPNMIDMNTRLPRMTMSVGAGWPVKVYMESVLPTINATFLGGQPNTAELEGLLAAMVAYIEGVGLPAENGLGPVGFDGLDQGTGSFSMAGNIGFGNGDRFL